MSPSPSRLHAQEGPRLREGRPVRPTHSHYLLDLQAQAGNRAVTQLLTGGAATIQRHNSWEHSLLGDTPPAQLGQAAVHENQKRHVLHEEMDRVTFFQFNPTADPRARFPDVNWFQLKASSLWLSNGELNALGDYLPNASAADTLPFDDILPVLQRMRLEILKSANQYHERRFSFMYGEASSISSSAVGIASEAAADVSAMDSATSELGTDRYKGLLSRNACHFAPFSWDRWAMFHNQALEEARLQHESGEMVTPVSAVSTAAAEHERQALLNNGYGDHFVEDSFAAGHLVNKTLVMQWFVEYVNDLPFIDQPWVGLPLQDVMDAMTTGKQPNIAGMDRYGHDPGTRTSGSDRYKGEDTIDPQSAQERKSQEDRIAGSGVIGTGDEQWENYQRYLQFLNSSIIQLAAGSVHDYLNESGLKVANLAGLEFQVGGDDTLLKKSDEIGAETVARAAELSRQAVLDTMKNGAPAPEAEQSQIFRLFPQIVKVPIWPDVELPFFLADFQTGYLKHLCFTKIFPDMLSSAKAHVIRYASPDMTDKATSVDFLGPKTSPMGDFEPSSSGELAG